MKNKKVNNAYFTVEAALVLPMVLGALLFGVYILLFQYNRCLTEQDVGMMAMWVSTLKGTEGELKTGMESRLEDWYEGKYIAWESSGPWVGVKYNYGYAEMEGSLTFPVPGWNFWNEENLWQEESACSFMRLEPVDFVRMCRKLLK